MDIPEIETGGPVYFYLLMHEMISVTDEASRAMIEKLNTMKITDFAIGNANKILNSEENIPIFSGFEKKNLHIKIGIIAS